MVESAKYDLYRASQRKKVFAVCSALSMLGFLHSVFVHSFFKPAGFLHLRHDVALDLSKRCGIELFRALYLVEFLNG